MRLSFSRVFLDRILCRVYSLIKDFADGMGIFRMTGDKRGSEKPYLIISAAKIIMSGYNIQCGTDFGVQRGNKKIDQLWGKEAPAYMLLETFIMHTNDLHK